MVQKGKFHVTYIVTHIQTCIVALNLWEHEKTGWMTHGMVSSSLIWPRFPSLSCSWLDEFFLKKCLVSCHESTDRSECCAGIPHPHPPGIVSNLASLFPAPHPEFTNVCHPILWASAQVPHHDRNSFYWPLQPCHRKGRARHVLITDVLLSSFSKTGDIYKIVSNILSVTVWIYTR